MQPHSSKSQLWLTKYTEVIENLRLTPQSQRLVMKRHWRPDSIRAGRVKLHKKSQPSSGVGVVEAEVVATVEAEVVVEAAADPETVEAEVSRPRQVTAGRKSILLQTLGGQDPVTLTSRLSTRARSTGTGGSPRDSAWSHGRARGRIFIANLPRIMVSNETGTSPFKQ